jgi:hypothetical protein
MTPRGLSFLVLIKSSVMSSSHLYCSHRPYKLSHTKLPASLPSQFSTYCRCFCTQIPNLNFKEMLCIQDPLLASVEHFDWQHLSPPHASGILGVPSRTCLCLKIAHTILHIIIQAHKVI